MSRLTAAATNEAYSRLVRLRAPAERIDRPPDAFRRTRAAAS